VYGLRASHEVFLGPLAIDVDKSLSVEVPDAWKDALSDKTIKVLPIVSDTKSQHKNGWCTYTYEHLQAPELEVMSGGINAKSPKAGALWRQGNLMHFGFDLSPAEMNETGQRLLINSIAYISRFTEDRPIIQTPCVFVQDKRIVDRNVIGRLVKRPEADLDLLKYYLAKRESEKLAGKSKAEVGEWFLKVQDWLHADDKGQLTVDDEAQSSGLAPANIAFFTKAIAALGDKEQAASARRLLARYAPDGPGEDGTAESWRSWFSKNESFLFFSDTGGYRWYVDPLAKKRGVPTEKLRGSARATLATPNPK
jgi:hypothetical protein